MQQLVSILLEDVPGALLRIHGVLCAQGWHVRSVSAGNSLERGRVRMTLAIEVPETARTKVLQRIGRLVNVIDVLDITDAAPHRELALIRVRASTEGLEAALARAKALGARLVERNGTVAVLELAAEPETIQGLIDLMQAAGETEVVRTGIVALAQHAS